MKNKKLLWILPGACLLIAAVVVLVCRGNDPESGWVSKPRPVLTEPGVILETEPGSSLFETGPAAPAWTMPQDPQTTEGSTPSYQPAPTNPPDTDKPAALLIPYDIPGATLTVGRLGAYRGTYFEDGSGRDTENVAMLLLINTGSKPVEYARLTVTLDSGSELIFEPTCIPAGGKLVVQESSGAAYPGGNMTSCRAEVALMDSMPMGEGVVEVTESEDGGITVKNLTQSPIATVRVFYKLYMAEEDGFVGGITYNVRYDNLQPGVPVTVYPTHYSYGYYKLIMVRIYEEGN